MIPFAALPTSLLRRFAAFSALLTGFHYPASASKTADLSHDDATNPESAHSDSPADAPANAPAPDAPTTIEETVAAVEDETNSAMREVIALYGARYYTEEPEPTPMYEDTPIVRLANTIIQQAIKERASHIHIEPDRRGVRVRCRIDGILHETMQMPKYIQAPLIGRYRVMAEMNLARYNVAQEGVIGIKYQGNDYNLQASLAPTMHGENMVFRVYDQSQARRGLNHLGLLKNERDRLEETVTTNASGLVLFAGPMGAGKTTMLYHVLNKLNTVEKNITTVEDATTYQLGGLQQIYTDARSGRTFGEILNALTRQDVNIVGVGRLTDAEMARHVASAAADALVLSTIRAENACDALLRLLDWGWEPSQIGHVVKGILAQKLVRRVCTHCQENYEIPQSDLRRFGFKSTDPVNPVTLVRGKGCEICRHTGYHGRIGVFEFLRVSDAVVRSLRTRPTRSALDSEALQYGDLDPMHYDGLVKILELMTTPQEVLATFPDLRA